jgi:hypothetical protein
MSKKYEVRCYDGEKVIGMVPYTDNLDYWDGNNYTCGSTGRHLGIGKTKDGRFYVCHGTQWQGERDYARIITETKAKELCLEHDPSEYVKIFGEEPPEL